MDTTLQTRQGAVTFGGKPLTLVGPELAVGDAAPDFSLLTGDLAPMTLADVTAKGKALVIVVPSLDTNVCALEAQTFHKRIEELPAGTTAYVVSRDLPFAQKRWAAENGAEKITYLSDYNARTFGPAYGVEIKELSLLARSTFVIGTDGKIAYAEVVKEVADQPDYDAVIASL